MNEEHLDCPPNSEELQGTLRRAVEAIRAVPPPEADFEAWRRGYAQAAAFHDSQQAILQAKRRKTMRRLVTLAAAAAALACVYLGVLNFNTFDTAANAFAQAVAQIQKAKTITWKTTIYERITSKDGQRHWYRTNLRKFAYTSPGLYRETYLDGKGNVTEVEITDAVHKKVLNLDVGNKVATIAEAAHVHRDPEGPFLDANRALKEPDLQFVERRKTASGDVNVFRLIEGKCFFDYWIDQKSKQLVEYHINQGKNVTLADYENDPMRNAEPEKEESGGTIVGSITNEIVYNADVDDSLFCFDVPEGYTIETKTRHYVTEQEMIDYLGIMADFNDRVFPDQWDISCDRTNQHRNKPKAERSPQSQKLIEADDYYMSLGLNGGPIREFIEENADWSDFRYLGKGVRLGGKDRIVCWYKLKDARDPNVYRVVYGDLSVKDVAAKDLPLPVEP